QPRVGQLEQSLRTQRSLEELDAERVLKRTDYRRSRADAAGLADALEAERVQRRKRLDVVDLDSRDLGRIRHQEVHETAVQELALLVVVHPLVEGAADALGDAAVNLPLDDRGIDHPSAVVHD